MGNANQGGGSSNFEGSNHQVSNYGAISHCFTYMSCKRMVQLPSRIPAWRNMVGGLLLDGKRDEELEELRVRELANEGAGGESPMVWTNRK